MNEGPIVRPAAMGAGLHLVQPGWMILDSSGEELGKVSELDGHDLVVVREGLMTPRHLRVPSEVIAEEDEAAMSASLSIEAEEADELYEI